MSRTARVRALKRAAECATLRLEREELRLNLSILCARLAREEYQRKVAQLRASVELRPLAQ